MNFISKARIHFIKVIECWYKLIVNKEIEARWVCFVLSDDEGLTIKPSTLTNVFNTG